VVSDSLGALQRPLESAGQPRPDDRPDAALFTRMLMAAAQDLDRPEPLMLAGTMVHDHDVLADRDPTVMVAAPIGDAIQVIADEPVIDLTEPSAAPPTRHRVRAVLLALLLVAALAGAGAYWYTEIRVPTFAVPTLVATNTSALAATIDGTDWNVQTVSQYQDLTVAGDILAQDPAPGSHLARGGDLVLTVSLGPPPVAVPAGLAGQPLAAATASLTAAGLTVGEVTHQFDEKVVAGSVVALAPGVGTEAPKGSGVPLIVSDGPQPRTIPAGLVGLTQDQATAKVKEQGLKVAVTTTPSETIPAGQVLDVNPAQGTQVPRDSTVTLVVSSGLPVVVVPDVSKQSVSDAATALQKVGLTVSGTQGNPLGTVKGTNPAAGTSVRKGSAVLIIVG